MSLSLDATSSKAACRSAIRRMDVSRSVCRVCLIAASSSTYFSWGQRPQHTLALGETPTHLREFWGGAWCSPGPCDMVGILSLRKGLWSLRQMLQISEQEQMPQALTHSRNAGPGLRDPTQDALDGWRT